MKKVVVRFAMLVGLACFAAMIGGCSQKQKNTAAGGVLGAGAGASISAIAGASPATVVASSAAGGFFGAILGNAASKDEPKVTKTTVK